MKRQGSRTRRGEAPGKAGAGKRLTQDRKAMREIVQGTASEIGDAFFHSLVQHLASALKVRYALVGEVLDAPQEHVRTLAVWAGGARGENLEYDLAGTPCENVAGQSTCIYPSGVQERFPEDRLLADMDVTSYLGTPLFDRSGEALGVLAVMDDKPLDDAPGAGSILELFAGRAGAELGRKRAEERLRESEERFRTLSEVACEGIAVHEDGVIFDVNSALAEMTGYEVSEIIGKNVLDFVAPESRAVVMRRIASDSRETDEMVGLRKDGSVFPVEVRGSSVTFRGRAARIVAVLDISERRAAEDALEQAREELESKIERQMLRRNPYGLTFRELTTLYLVSAGRADKEIARELGISPRTVHKHVGSILSKMDAGSRTEASVRAVKEDLLG